MLTYAAGLKDVFQIHNLLSKPNSTTFCEEESPFHQSKRDFFSNSVFAIVLFQSC